MKYIPGTLVQHRDGYVYIKTENGFMAEHRYVAQTKMLKRKLKPGECVLRLKPTRHLNVPENLVVVQHSLVKFKLLPKARVIFVPKYRKETV